MERGAENYSLLLERRKIICMVPFRKRRCAIAKINEAQDLINAEIGMDILAASTQRWKREADPE